MLTENVGYTPWWVTQLGHRLGELVDRRVVEAGPAALLYGSAVRHMWTWQDFPKDKDVDVLIDRGMGSGLSKELEGMAVRKKVIRSSDRELWYKLTMPDGRVVDVTEVRLRSGDELWQLPLTSTFAFERACLTGGRLLLGDCYRSVERWRDEVRKKVARMVRGGVPPLLVRSRLAEINHAARLFATGWDMR